MTWGNPALRLLAALKTVGWCRSMRRRLSTPSGAIFGLLGLAATALWLGSVLLHGQVATSLLPVEQRAAAVAGVLLGLSVFTAVGALSHRGLYLPKDEIERLLAAPVSRADLVRYRMCANLGRSSLFALVVAAIAAPRMPVPGFAFAGTLVAVGTLPLFGQTVSILAGDAENRVGRLMRRVPIGAVQLVVGAALWGLVMAVLFGIEIDFEVRPDGTRAAVSGPWLLEHPAYEAATFVFRPWAQAITAQSAQQFLPVFGFALLFAFALFETTARLPIDFRSLSLETSADVARRLARMRSGASFLGGARRSRRLLGWHVPWIFGRGPFGAIAWMKLCGIVRRARGALLYALFVLGVAIAMTSIGQVGDLTDPLIGAVLIAALGVFYLGAGLRLDFRADLDRMEIVKAWPLPPWRVFLAIILPEVVVVAGMVDIAIGARALWTREFPPELWLVLAATPLVGLLWIALDNAVFLFAPVRFVPGQGSAMHHTGRTMVLLLVRLVLIFVLAVAGTLAVVVSTLLAQLAGLGLRTAEVIAGAALAGVLALAIGVCVGCGAIALRRFDVARERTQAG